MAPNRTNRVSLADLVMMVLMCGLIAALFASFQGAANPAVIFALIGLVIFVWVYFKAMRTAIPCPECGRRVLQPKPRKIPTAITCPQCGQLQRERAEALKISRNIIFGLLGLLFVLVPVFVVTLNDETSSSPSLARLLIVLGLVAWIALTSLAILAILAYRALYLGKSRVLTCELCGTVIPLEPEPAPVICPYCRQRKLQGNEARKQAARNLWTWIAVLASVTIFLASFFHESLGSWLGTPPSNVVAFATAFVLTLAILVLPLLLMVFLQRRWLKGEPSAIAMARKFVNEDGEIVKDGPTTIWYSGTSDPIPMIREQMAIVRDRFAAFLGTEAVNEPRFRVLCFHDRGAFSRFHARYLPLVNIASWDGAYIFRANGLTTLCTAESPCRVTDPEVTVRSRYASALLEGVQLALPAPWLQVGVNLNLTYDGKGGELQRLNRKMVAALGRGTALSTELFALKSRDLMRLIRKNYDPREFQKLYQVSGQSWSVFEFLFGDQAPNERRSTLRRFLEDKRLKTHQEDSFREHFGFGFAAVLDDWRKWVLDRGIGTYDPPPDRVRDALLSRVIPVIKDRQSRREDRVQAIRDLGGQGFLLGADALIELLRDSDDTPKEEVVWALSMISGLAWDEDPDRWQDWWDNLPRTEMEPLSSRSGFPA